MAALIDEINALSSFFTIDQRGHGVAMNIMVTHHVTGCSMRSLHTLRKKNLSNEYA